MKRAGCGFRVLVAGFMLAGLFPAELRAQTASGGPFYHYAPRDTPPGGVIRVIGERFGESADGRGGISELQVQLTEVDVRGRIAWIGTDRSVERGARAVQITVCRARRAKKVLCLRVSRVQCQHTPRFGDRLGRSAL